MTVTYWASINGSLLLKCIQPWFCVMFFWSKTSSHLHKGKLWQQQALMRSQQRAVIYHVSHMLKGCKIYHHFKQKEINLIYDCLHYSHSAAQLTTITRLHFGCLLWALDAPATHYVATHSHSNNITHTPPSSIRAPLNIVWVSQASV